MKKFIIFILILLSTLSTYARDFQKEFVDSFKKSDYETVKSILTDWEKEDSKNPEMMIAWFNYYLNRSAVEHPTMGKMKDGRYGMYSWMEYSQDDVKTGISYLDKALKSYPNRLDIHLGKASSLIKSENYKQAVDSIINTIKISKKNKNKWFWTNNQFMGEDGKNVLLSSLQDYCQQIFYDFDTTKDSYKLLVETINKEYPNEIVFLNYESLYYSRTGDNKKAIEILKKAYELDKTDYIIIGNIAYDYELMENYQEAKQWYEMLLEIDNPEAKEYGQRGLDIIKDKLK